MPYSEIELSGSHSDLKTAFLGVQKLVNEETKFRDLRQTLRRELTGLGGGQKLEGGPRSKLKYYNVTLRFGPGIDLDYARELTEKAIEAVAELEDGDELLDDLQLTPA